jgi:lipoprotein-anchoring transpeptidase ErfK/SrfK
VLGVAVDGVLDRQVWDTLRGDATTDVLVQYTLTAEDLSYPFVPVIPEDYAEQARMASLGYSGPQEMLAERFHMDPKLLAALNPEADFRAGSMVWVASVDAQPVTGKISRIVADKGRSQVRAYDSENRLIVAYPATIGSADTPSPTGDHAVESVAPNPVYYYDPANFVQGNNIEKLELPPGPNNPVGSTWIDLSDPGYGIHGTPDPTKIGKTASHGCVRLTNWDVEELAGMVEPGVIVSFVD